MLNISEIRKDFPIFSAYPELAYLDNGATSQKPECVIKAVNDYYKNANANPFRGLYGLSDLATEKYEEARRKVAGFINAGSADEVIFTRNATESLNLVAFSLGEMCVNEGDEIIVSVAEHHSNMLPWRLMAERKGAIVRYLEPEESGEFSPAKLKGMLNDKTKIVSLTAMSNIYGFKNDIKALAAVVHEAGAYLIADGAQSVPHSVTDVRDTDVDFLAFSGHKMLGPMGIGVLYCKEEILRKMPPYMSGGEMIENVSLEEITYAGLPHKFEAGTVNAGGAIGLGAAIDYIDSIGMEAMIEREEMLTKLAMDQIAKIDHVHVIGDKNYKNHNGIITFKIDNVHPHDVASILADSNVAVRAGHHCAEPLHAFMGIPSTTRASFMFYNTEEEVLKFTEAMSQIRSLMGYR